MPTTASSSSRLSRKRFDVSNAEQLHCDRRFESVLTIPPLPASQLSQMQPRTTPVDYSTMRIPLSPTSPTSAAAATKRQSSSSNNTLTRKRRRMESSAPYPIEGCTSLADDELEDDRDRAPIVLRVRVPPSSQASRRNRMSNSHSNIPSYPSSPPSSSYVPSLTPSPSSKSSSLGSMGELESSLPLLSIGIATPPATPPSYYATLNGAGNMSEEDEMTVMDVDEPELSAPTRNKEKLYIRIRVPPNMRLKSRRTPE